MTWIKCRSAALAAAAALFGPSVAVAGDVCPASAMPAEASSAPAGWRAWRSDEARELPLVNAGFSDGPPQERAFLNPVSSSQGRNSRVDTYDFRSSTLRTIWLICQYQGSTIALIRESGVRGKRCRVSHTLIGQNNTLVSISCE